MIIILVRIARIFWRFFEVRCVQGGGCRPMTMQVPGLPGTGLYRERLMRGKPRIYEVRVPLISIRRPITGRRRPTVGHHREWRWVWERPPRAQPKTAVGRGYIPDARDVQAQARVGERRAGRRSGLHPRRPGHSSASPRRGHGPDLHPAIMRRPPRSAASRPRPRARPRPARAGFPPAATPGWRRGSRWTRAGCAGTRRWPAAPAIRPSPRPAR